MTWQQHTFTDGTVQYVNTETGEIQDTLPAGFEVPDPCGPPDLSELECPGVNVTVCNPLDLAPLLTELEAINANTDELELKADVVNLNTEQLETLIETTNTTLSSIDVSLSAVCPGINVTVCNTSLTVDTGLDLTALETNTASATTELQLANTELDLITAELVTLNAKLNEDCVGSPVNVNICNPGGVADLTAVEANTASTVTELQTANTTLTAISDSLGGACPGINVTVCNTTLTVDTGLDLSTLETNTATTATSVDAVNTTLGTTNTALADVNSELDAQTTLLTSIDAALSAVCPGINVTVCNTTLTVDTGLDLTALETNTGSTTTELQSVNTELDLITAELVALNAKLNEDCVGSPVNVNICNPGGVADLTAVEANTANTVTQLQSANTTLTAISDSLGAACPGLNVTVCNTTLTVDTGLSLTALETNTANTVSELQTIEATLTAIETVMTADCADTVNRLKVEVCNPTDLTAVENTLSSILASVQAIDANTDGIEASLTQLISDVQAGNATLVTIDAAIDALLPELQAINANTDTLEAQLTSLQTVVQNEFDATQALLQTEFDEQQAQFTTMVTSLGNIEGALSGACPGINVTVCNTSLAVDTGLSLTSLETNTANTVTELQTIDAVLDTIKVDTAAMATDLAALEVLATSIDSSLSAVCPGINVTVCNTSLAVDTGLSLATLETNTANTATNVSTVNATLGTTNTELAAVNAELDSQTTLLTSIDGALSGACPGINVTVCNASLAVDTGLSLTSLETNTANTAANVSTVNTTLGTTNTELAAVNAELDTQTTALNSIDAILTAATAACGSGTPLKVDICSGGSGGDFSTVNTNTGNTVTELQAVNAELDTQTTALNAIETTLTALETVAQASCGSAEVQNVNVCPDATVTVATTRVIATGNYTIPAGTRDYTVAVRSGVALVDGVQMNTGESSCQPVQSYGAQKVVYPAVNITGVTGEVVVVYNV